MHDVEHEQQQRLVYAVHASADDVVDTRNARRRKEDIRASVARRANSHSVVDRRYVFDMFISIVVSML